MSAAATNPFFEFGVNLEASRLGLDRPTLIRRRAQAEVMDGPEGVPFRRELCKIAAAAFDAAGDSTNPKAILFRNLASSDEWYSTYNRFTDPVLKALSKQAGILLPAAAATHDKMGGGVLKNLIALGVLGGGTAGSLAFLLNRNANQSSAENAQLLEKIRAYKELKRDIEEDMDSSGAMEVGEEEQRYNV